MDLKNKILNNFSLLLIWIFFISLNSFAQDNPGSSKGDLTFYLDHAVFAGQNEKSYTEFNLMFYAAQLNKNSNLKSAKSEIQLDLKIKDQNENEISKRSWILEAILNGNNSENKVIYDRFAEELIPGEYKINLIAQDLSGNSKGELSKNISVQKIEKEKWSAGDIEFITSVENNSAGSHFNKGDLKIIPNPSRRYGILNSKLLFLYEIYGIKNNITDLIVDYSITDKENNIQKSLNDIKIKVNGNSSSVIHGIDIANLNSGIYSLNANIKDSVNNKNLTVSRNFEIIQADFFTQQNSLSEENAGIFKTILSYIGTQNQLNTFNSLNQKGKSEFIIQYWKNLDPVPSTSENEFLQEIQKRFIHAKNNFGWYQTKGWETDRGRICIKYGIPHQVNQFNLEAESAPYEIWIYNENKTYEFVFGDLRSNGKYVLLHSNREGEVYNSNWQSR